MFFFVFKGSGGHRDLHSFPTRRSSDLVARWGAFSWPCKGGPGPATFSLRPEHIRLASPADADEKVADRKSTRLNSSHLGISYAVFCLKKKKGQNNCDH